ncbi:MAG: SDR family oxidoreductase [Planctomycetes bacterium]|nr:SDR family oxidoreductase [Planctomycetota bacterium]
MVAPSAAPFATLVTGSSRGIGRAIAEALARAGHRLVLTARDEAGLRATAAAVQELGAEVLTVVADLRQPDAPTRVVAAAEQRFGGVDAVISNAGTAPSDKVENTTPAMLQEVFDLHVGAPLAFARAVVPGMKRRGRGCLLHLASTAGLRGYPFTSAYTAGKHGMVGLARALHAELGPAGIRVLALCPGFVDTDITRSAAAAIAARGRITADEAMARMAAQNRIGRMHRPHEVAAAVVELLQSSTTGCVYDLDQERPGFVDPA